jgi:hypothetical protein
MADQCYFTEGSEAMLALEAMVDRVGVRNVLYALEYICRGKADHVRSNSQDEALAKCWDHSARQLEKAASVQDAPGRSQ